MSNALKNVTGTLLGLLCLCVGGFSLAHADDISLQATVNASQVALNQALQLTLTVTGSKNDVGPIDLPSINGFSAKYMGPSTSISIVNGDYHSEHSFIYDLFPNKTGHFQIPSITATIGGQSYTTQPIAVDVIAASAQPAQGSGQSSQAPTMENLKDKILTMVSVGKKDVYVGERVPLTIRLLVNSVPMRDIQPPEFDKNGFTADDFQQPQQYTQVVNGVNYDVVAFKTYIYPGQAGDLSVGPVQIQGNVVYKSGQDNPFGDNDIFGDSMFKGFFGSYATRPVTVTSQPITLHVSALPQEGKPEDFSGAVGQFDFQAKVSPLQVQAGDPLTLTMDIKGTGNLKDLQAPSIQDPQFKTYDPTVKDIDGGEHIEQVIIPASDKVLQVPVVHFSYFDPNDGQYKTMTQGPFTIKVTAPSPDQQFKAVGFSNVEPSPSLGPEVSAFSWKKKLFPFWHEAGQMVRSLWFWVEVGILLVAGLLFYGWRRFQDRLTHDRAFARRMKASSDAKKDLAEAREALMVNNAKEFYTLLTKTMRDYLANHWNKSSAGLSVEGMLSGLQSIKANETCLAQVKRIFEQSDLVCFAGHKPGSTQMHEDLEQTKDLLAYFEKRLPK